MDIEIRSLDDKVTADQREYIERRLLYALGRFGDHVSRVMVRLEDMNGPRGGLDTRCHIEAKLAGQGMLVVDIRDVEMEPAVSRAADRIARRVRDELDTRRDRATRGAAVHKADPEMLSSED